MAAKKLFQYAVLFHPKVVTDAQGNETQAPDSVLIQPEYMLAADEKQVALTVARKIDEQYLDKLDQVEICVRPF